MGTAQRNISIPIMQTTNDTINNNEHDSSNQIYDFEEFISDQLLADFMAAFIWLMPVLCLLAVTFCVLNAIVYSQQRAARFAWYLVAVDLGDGLCSLVELLHSFTFFAVRSDAYLHLVVKWYMAKYFAASCRRAAVCLNAFASLERFLAIAFPLKSVRLCGKPSLIIASVFALSLGTHIYFVLEFEVVSKGDGGWNLAHTTLRKNHADAFILWSTVASAVFAYTPLVAIILLNSVLLVFLRRHAASLQNVRRARGVTRSRTSEECDDVSSGSSLSNGKTVACNTTTDGSATTGTGDTSKRKRENQTTKMVMVFSTVFLMMALPRMLNSTARSLFDDYGPKGKEKNLYRWVKLVCLCGKNQTYVT